MSDGLKFIVLDCYNAEGKAALENCGATLAGKAHSFAQAIDVGFLKGRFWATQYHPEYDYAEMSNLTQARKNGLLKDGVFSDEASLETYSADLKAYQKNPARTDIAEKYKLLTVLHNPASRTNEIRNWLRYFFNVDA